MYRRVVRTAFLAFVLVAVMVSSAVADDGGGGGGHGFESAQGDWTKIIWQGQPPNQEGGVPSYGDPWAYCCRAWNQLDAACAALHVDHNAPDMVARHKLSNAETGGRFYAFASKFHTNGTDYPWYFPSSQHYLLETFYLTYGNEYAQYIWWAYPVDANEIQGAIDDFNTIINGGDLGGGSGGGSGGGGTVEGEFYEFMLNTSKLSSELSGCTRVLIDTSIVQSTALPIKSGFVKCYIRDAESHIMALSLYFSSGDTSVIPSGYSEPWTDWRANDTSKYSLLDGPGVTYQIVGTDLVLTPMSSYNLYMATTPRANENITSNSAGFNDAAFMESLKIVTDVGSGGGGTDPDPDTPNPWPSTPDPDPNPDPPTVPDVPSDPVVGGDSYTNTNYTTNNYSWTTNNYTYNNFQDVVDGIREILDAMDSHCIHIQNAIGNAVNDLGQKLVGALNNVSTNVVGAINRLGTNIDSALNSQFSALKSYLRQLFVWLAEQFQYTFGSRNMFDDTSIINWLKRIYQVLINNNRTTPTPDPIDDGKGFWDWLIEQFANFFGEFTSDKASQVGSLLQSLTQFFPFSIPFDLAFMAGLLVAQPVTPVLDFPIPVPAQINSSQRILVHIDCTGWNNAAAICRLVMYFLFCYALAQKVPDWFNTIKVGDNW